MPWTLKILYNVTASAIDHFQTGEAMNLKKWFNMMRSRKNKDQVYPRYHMKNSGPNRAQRRKQEHMVRGMVKRGLSQESINLALSPQGTDRIELPRLVDKMLNNWSKQYRNA